MAQAAAEKRKERTEKDLQDKLKKQQQKELARSREAGSASAGSAARKCFEPCWRSVAKYYCYLLSLVCQISRQRPPPSGFKELMAASGISFAADAAAACQLRCC